jgi:NAD(P)H dehydrogenase (quinone)
LSTVNNATQDVAVVGATGQTGRAVVEALHKHGMTVRAITRNPQHEGQLRSSGSARVALADLSDPESLTDAFTGVRAVYIIPPLLNPAEAQLVSNATGAAERAGVQLIGYHSALHADEPAMPHHRRKNDAEIGLRRGEVPWVVLRPAMYCQTPMRLQTAAGRRLPFGGDALFTPIDLADVAQVSARVLADSSFAFGTFELCGPDALTLREMWSILHPDSEIEPSDPHRYCETIGNSGLTEWSQIADVAAMFAHYETIGLKGNSAVAAMLLGRAPTRFADVVAGTQRV